jgi:membrane complex biogenesis BtpA family protein
MHQKTFQDIFPAGKPVIGMIHVPALPGTPKHNLEIKKIINLCVSEALLLKNKGLDGIMIENMHDIPYVKRKAGPEIVAVMTVTGNEIKRATQLPCGIQILAGANKEALAAAHAAGLDFIRAEGFVFGHLADEGYMDADAGELLRFRKQMDAENILILTDIKKKHSSHAITSDVSITETAKAASFFLSDGLIITGKSTGNPADIKEVEEVKKSSELPVLIGSGLTDKNIHTYFHLGDGFIVGSWFKKDGLWSNDPDPKRLERFMKEVLNLRNQ